MSPTRDAEAAKRFFLKALHYSDCCVQGRTDRHPIIHDDNGADMYFINGAISTAEVFAPLRSSFRAERAFA